MTTPSNKLGDGDHSALSEQLLSGFMRGERDKAHLFFKLRGALLHEIRSHPLFQALAGHHSDEDLLSELWATLFQRGSLARFKNLGPGSLRAFLFRALDDLVVDCIRRHHAAKRGGGRQVLHLDPEADGSSSGAVAPPADSDPGPVSAAALADLVAQCEAKLSQRQARVWRLRSVEGLDFGAIGKRLEMTASAARGLFKRALEKLAEPAQG